MKNRVQFIFNLISIFVFAVMLCWVAFSALPSPTVYAAESEAVLQDLRKDKTFNENDYPYVADDYSLHVIQIAESANKELFIYAYQPCHDTYDLVGTKISISYGYSVNGSGLTPKLYNLRLVSTSGTLDKYYVEGFTVPNDGDRYYNIVEIFRIFNAEIDESDDTFPKTDMAYSVGQQWYVCDLNGSKHYEMNTFNTLSVETIFNSNVEFPDGIKWANLVGVNTRCDCWFYCFNVEEYKVKHIYDADLNYSIRDASRSLGLGLSGETHYENERLNQVVTLRDTDVMTYSGSGLCAREYEWNRILSSKKFIELAENQHVTFVENDKQKILSSQWVFTYLETETYSQSGYGYSTTFFSDVYDVGLLRLHFQDTSGSYYDLGVVNDLTDPDNISSGKGDLKSLTEAFEEFWEKFVMAIAFILFLILAVVILNFIAPIKNLLKGIFKAVCWVVGLPFRLLKSLFKR